MKILILRPAELLENTLRKLREEGFESYGCPFVKLTYNEFEVPEHDFAIITSQNAAKVVVEKGVKLGRVIAIGKKTAKILEMAGIHALTPTKFDSETLFEEFSEMLKGKRVIALRSNAGSDVLKSLSEISDFRDVEVYRIEKLQGNEQKREIDRVKEGFYDAIVFSSSMIAQSFLGLCDDECLESLRKITLVAIGPPTAKVLEDYGLKPLIPEEYTFDGVLKLLKSIKA
ncbi:MULTISPECIES: uroporphyrinogen-III synthase [unclassified Archaeoglobus]|mgnify:CR=1 FL=1|jgi:uroporphyrinogen-III synthase|uniref:uroporphyrinogen-III synthase n=1 Tax=unclassified Archaeoglobus TaxID=2643606 RepID=UPI0025BC67CB|nr:MULTISPECIES: uroporphyrinogen-III synthase [unclassified Archaeoglobus]